jgi:hypothetical protein
VVFYGDKFPGIGLAFLIFYAGSSATSMIGLYSLSVHTQGVPHLSMAINVVKLVVVAILLTAVGHSLLSVVTITAVAMVVGELLLMGTLQRRRASSGTSKITIIDMLASRRGGVARTPAGEI